MIASLRGVVTERTSTSDSAVDLVVDVAGVGYRLLCAPKTAASAQVGHETSFAVHTHVREGAITLYGFASPEERTAFELLLGAHGVGPGPGARHLEHPRARTSSPRSSRPVTSPP